MKKIINGLRYDSERAIEIGYYSSPHSQSDFHWWEATLYKSKQGKRFFLVGEGGPMSRFGKSVPGGMGYGSDLIPMDKEEALAWAERYLNPDDIEEHFADSIEDA